jgi:hypothetical protein
LTQIDGRRTAVEQSNRLIEMHFEKSIRSEAVMNSEAVDEAVEQDTSGRRVWKHLQPTMSRMNAVIGDRELLD